MIFKTYNFSKISYGSLCEHCFSHMQQPLNKWRKRFMTDVLWLILSIQGKINFLQLARYGNYGEQHYRRQFEQDFDFLSFNSHLPEEHAGERKVIAFDPSHIPKSGKHTPGVGYFRSGCADQSKWGLEICGIAAIDSDNHTALHLEAVQTIKGEDQTLLEYYAAMLTSRKDALQEISKTVVADAHFSKETFVTALCKENFQVVSRLRDDVRLQYIAKVEKTGKRGRPKNQRRKGGYNESPHNIFYASPRGQSFPQSVYRHSDGRSIETQGKSCLGAIGGERSGKRFQNHFSHRYRGGCIGNPGNLPITFSNRVHLQRCQTVYRTYQLSVKGGTQSILFGRY